MPVRVLGSHRRLHWITRTTSTTFGCYAESMVAMENISSGRYSINILSEQVWNLFI